MYKIQVESSPSLKNIFLRKFKPVFVILQRLFSSSWSISQNIVVTKIYVHTDYYGAIFSKSQRLVFKFLAFVYWSTPVVCGICFDLASKPVACADREGGCNAVYCFPCLSASIAANAQQCPGVGCRKVCIHPLCS